MDYVEKVDYLRKQMQNGRREHAVLAMDLNEKSELQVGDLINQPFTVHVVAEKGVNTKGFRRFAITGCVSNAATDNIAFDVLDYLKLKISSAIRGILRQKNDDRAMVINAGHVRIAASSSTCGATDVTVELMIKTIKFYDTL